jgi:hypothetical protein
VLVSYFAGALIAPVGRSHLAPRKIDGILSLSIRAESLIEREKPRKIM